MESVPPDISEFEEFKGDRVGLKFLLQLCVSILNNSARLLDK
jgi:hypothetical protein